MMVSVVSESLSSVPAFLLSSDISNGSGGAGFFPAGIVGEGTGWNGFALDQFFRRVFRRQRRRHGFGSATGKFFRKFFDKALSRPGASFAECANRPAGHVIADRS